MAVPKTVESVRAEKAAAAAAPNESAPATAPAAPAAPAAPGALTLSGCLKLLGQDLPINLQGTLPERQEAAGPASLWACVGGVLNVIGAVRRRDWAAAAASAEQVFAGQGVTWTAEHKLELAKALTASAQTEALLTPGAKR